MKGFAPVRHVANGLAVSPDIGAVLEERKRVLLVDDDEDILDAVGLALRERGYEVIVARDGTEGLVKAERDRPDVIVLDVVMPRRSGFTVLDHLCGTKRQAPPVPVILMSGNDDERHRRFAEEHGVRVFVSKPFDVDHLVGQVDRVMAG